MRQLILLLAAAAYLTGCDGSKSPSNQYDLGAAGTDLGVGPGPNPSDLGGTNAPGHTGKISLSLKRAN